MVARPPASVRIIGGDWNGRKIRVPPTAQPSGDRVREALLSCLGDALIGSDCLDLFAGSGALGFCAASRGARHITFVEKNRRAAQQLRRTAAELAAPATVLPLPAQRFLAAGAAPRFNIVFLDPPFADYETDSDWATLLAALLPWLADAALVYCEHRRHFTPPDGWRIRTRRRAGAVHWQILHPPAARA